MTRAIGSLSQDVGLSCEHYSKSSLFLGLQVEQLSSARVVSEALLSSMLKPPRK
jgi:hypothetical protein